MPNTPTSAEPAPRDSREHLNRVRPGATGPKAAVEAQPFVNGKGQFNVPIGSYKPEKVSLYDRPNLLAASHALRDAELRVQDFRQTLGSAPQGAFVYVDPPYYPLSRTANFTSYTQHDFSPE